MTDWTEQRRNENEADATPLTIAMAALQEIADTTFDENACDKALTAIAKATEGSRT